ncbi:MAG: ATP-binding protein [Sandaracinus sp.]
MTTCTPETGGGSRRSWWTSSSRRCRRLVPRLLSAGHEEALMLVREVLELEAQGRLERRVDRLRRASSSLRARPSTCSIARVYPRACCVASTALARRLHRARRGRCSSSASPVWAWKPHRVRARPRPPRARAQRLLRSDLPARAAAPRRRDLSLPRALRQLDAFDLVILDDIGYVQQSADEASMSSSRSWPSGTSAAPAHHENSLVFSEWGRIFKSPMTTAVIRRLVHHATILEIERDSIRAEDAQRRGGKRRRDEKEGEEG